MCGINGILSKKGKTDYFKKKIIHANELIHHRGPDETGVFSIAYNNYSVVMGMQRLSVIDINGGSQPIYSEDGMKVIVFNGEIYNYQELKKELLQLDASFQTDTDTEVVLKIYEYFGVNGFSRLDGMFAFSIYDKSIDKIFIGRDYFGEKPLYYWAYDKEFIWGSELKSVKASIEEDLEISIKGMSLYFQLGYIPSPYTIYKGIKKLKPDHYLEINCRDLEVKEFPIHNSFSLKEKYKDYSFKQAVKKTKELVYESVLSRSVADVPIGTFLSGRVDSSIISLCLAQQKNEPINTFSIGFEQKSYDETDKAEIVAKQIGSNHHVFEIGFSDIKSELDKVLLNYDEPFADSSAIPTYLVSKFTSQKVKVALTGDGGDEVFGGYNKYYVGNINKNYTKLIPEGVHRRVTSLANKFLVDKSDRRGFKFKARKTLNAISYNDEFYYKMISLGFQINELKKILRSDVTTHSVYNLFDEDNNLEGLHNFRNIDRNISLEGDMLVKVDRASMLASLECRAPFLNKELWQFTNSLPANYLLNGRNKKYLLKEAFKNQFPEGFLEKPKSGFGVPVGDWLRNDLKEELIRYIESERLEKQAIFNVSEITKIVLNHVNGTIDNTFRVWNFYCFQKWYFNVHIK